MKSRGCVVLFVFLVVSALAWMSPISSAQDQQRVQAHEQSQQDPLAQQCAEVQQGAAGIWTPSQRLLGTSWTVYKRHRATQHMHTNIQGTAGRNDGSSSRSVYIEKLLSG